MPPEPMELWARGSEIKEGLSDWWALALSGSRALPRGRLGDRAAAAWVSQEKVRHFGWEGPSGTAQGWAGLAEGDRVILLWVF